MEMKGNLSVLRMNMKRSLSQLTSCGHARKRANWLHGCPPLPILFACPQLQCFRLS